MLLLIYLIHFVYIQNHKRSNLIGFFSHIMEEDNDIETKMIFQILCTLNIIIPEIVYK